ncbi:hypothetical protein G6F21_014751 [Rhizopus arrhizus]|nr:hypothetical protein G6F21_014751 [Rhizopus arrhizus]
MGTHRRPNYGDEAGKSVTKRQVKVLRVRTRRRRNVSLCSSSYDPIPAWHAECFNPRFSHAARAWTGSG